MKMHESLTLNRIVAAADESQETLSNPGFCIVCGAEAEGVEPDARRYQCEACGQNGVYGAEELMLYVA